MSENTVRKYVAGPEDKRLITTEPTSATTRKGRGRNGNLRYTILPIQGVADHYHDQQMLKLEEDAERQRIAERMKKNPGVTVCAALCALWLQRVAQPPLAAKKG